MRIASFRTGTGAGFGIIGADGIRPASPAFAARHPGVRAVLAAGALDALAADCAVSPPVPLDAVTLLPPVPDAGQIVCVGINYAKRYPLDGKVVRPEHIILFAKTHAALLGHGAPLAIPPGEAAETFDYEGEIAVVIGKGGRHIPEAEAMAHVAGWTVLNDGSVRGWQKHSLHAGKNFAGSGACGPWMVTSDEIADPDAMTITTRLNDEVVQCAAVSDMFFSIPQVIAYVSTFTALMPGDIIATGSPDGAGGSRTPPRFLRAGDRLEMTISGVGTLANSVGAP